MGAASATPAFALPPWGGGAHLSPGSDLPGRALLLLARLHRLGFGRATEAVVQAILAELTPRLTVLVAFPAGHQALEAHKRKELQPYSGSDSS